MNKKYEVKSLTKLVKMLCEKLYQDMTIQYNDLLPKGWYELSFHFRKNEDNSFETTIPQVFLPSEKME